MERELYQQFTVGALREWYCIVYTSCTVCTTHQWSHTLLICAITCQKGSATLLEHTVGKRETNPSARVILCRQHKLCNGNIGNRCWCDFDIDDRLDREGEGFQCEGNASHHQIQEHEDIQNKLN